MECFNIPLLTKDDIEVRVQSVSKSSSGKVGAVLLLYKDARVDMRILDKVFGVENWQREHYECKGNLFCKVGVNINFSIPGKTESWIWKSDCGVESNTEAQKGEASDSFKRACFNWGIGRELYTAPFVYVELAPDEYSSFPDKGKEVYRCKNFVKFKVAEVKYNEQREISALIIVDTKGRARYIFGKTKHTNFEVPTEKPEVPVVAQNTPKPKASDGPYKKALISELEKRGIDKKDFCIVHGLTSAATEEDFKRCLDNLRPQGVEIPT